MSADPPAMSPTNSSALSDLSRSPSPTNEQPNPPQPTAGSSSKPSSATQPRKGSAPATGPSPPPLSRRESHDSDVAAQSDGSSSLTNLSDEQPEADADEDGENENDDDPDAEGSSDAKDAAPSPEPVNKTPKRSVIPDGMWAWATKSKSKSKSKSKDPSDDEAEPEEELESEEPVESEGSDPRDAKAKGTREPSVESTVARPAHARTNSIPNRPRSNSNSKDAGIVKVDDNSGSNDTPVKSPSLSEISEELSVKEEEAKVAEDVQVQLDGDGEPAEQEAVAPVVLIEAFDRVEGMETLTALEVALAMTRDYLYNTKMDHYALEEEALNNGSHPELLHQYEELEARKKARLAIAQKKYEAAVSCIKRKRQEDTMLTMNSWRYERDELQRKMADEYIGVKRALEREKANLDRYSSPRPVTPPMPTEFAEEPPKKRVKVEKLIRSVTAKNVRKNIESALSYPSVDGVSHEELDADLIAMGIRGKPADTSPMPPMPNGHRELLPIMPQPQGEYQSGPPVHQAQFGHQAPLHIHHIHAPFPHSHQNHSTHMQPPPQQVVQHHGPSFSSWGPEPQQSYPHQHHHHSHVQHNHPPAHMQSLPGLPQHMQAQGSSQSPSSGHRMNYLPSQPTTHAVLQGSERPPSSHMHVSSNTQQFTMNAGPSPNTWNEIRKDREPTMTSPSNHRQGRRSSPIPPPSHMSHSHRDQSMFPPQLPPQGPPMHGPAGPPSSHMASHPSRSGPPPPPPMEQRRSGEHRSSKSTSSKRKAEDEPDMRRDAKRPELNGPSGSHSRSANVSPQDQRRDPGRSLPSFSVVPPYQQNTANILKERTQPWDQPSNSQPPSTNHVHSRHARQGSPGAGLGPQSHTSLPPPSSSRQHSGQMSPPNDPARYQAQKAFSLPSSMFPPPSHTSSQALQRPPSMMGSHGRPPSPPAAMRKSNLTPPHQLGPPEVRSPGKPAYGPPLPPPAQQSMAPQPSNSSGNANHMRSTGGGERGGLPGPAPSGAPRGYGPPKSSSVPNSLSTMGPPLPPLNPTESAKSDRPPPSNVGGPVPPPVPVPVPPPTQLPPVQKYGHGLASRLFPPAAPAGGRSASG